MAATAPSTPRERDVYDLLVRGQFSKEIAERLAMCAPTVGDDRGDRESHRSVHLIEGAAEWLIDEDSQAVCGPETKPPCAS